jgi:hypothetical protein
VRQVVGRRESTSPSPAPADDIDIVSKVASTAAAGKVPDDETEPESSEGAEPTKAATNWLAALGEDL